MAEQKIKFKVSIKELSFEFEGTRDIGNALQAGLSRSIGGLLDTQRTVMALPGVADDPIDAQVVDDAPAMPLNSHIPPPEKVRKSRKPKGIPVKTLLRELKQNGFFTEPRTAEVIREHLRINGGYNVQPGSLAGRLTELLKMKELHRQEDADSYVYKDTPFDESPRTPNPPTDAAE